MNIFDGTEYADSVLEVSVGANKKAVEKLSGDDSMCQALLEMMEPQLRLREQEIVKKVTKEVRREVIRGAVDILRRFGHKDLEIKREIMQTYELSEEEAGAYL